MSFSTKDIAEAKLFEDAIFPSIKDKYKKMKDDKDPLAEIYFMSAVFGNFLYWEGYCFGRQGKKYNKEGFDSVLDEWNRDLCIYLRKLYPNRKIHKGKYEQ